MIVAEYWSLKLDWADGEYALITEHFDAGLFSDAVRHVSRRGFFSLAAIIPAIKGAGTVSRREGHS